MLTKQEILTRIKNNAIVIEPFNEALLNTNSYDLTLGEYISYYPYGYTLDAKISGEEQLITEKMSKDAGFLLEREIGFYLITTVEVTYTPNIVPVIWAKSSIARMGLNIGLNGGFGDLGYKGRWTFGVQVNRDTYIYPNMPIVQVAFFEPTGEISELYGDLSKSNYQLDSIPDKPVPHKFHKNPLFNQVK